MPERKIGRAYPLHISPKSVIHANKVNLNKNMPEMAGAAVLCVRNQKYKDKLQKYLKMNKKKKKQKAQCTRQ